MDERRRELAAVLRRFINPSLLDLGDWASLTAPFRDLDVPRLARRLERVLSRPLIDGHAYAESERDNFIAALGGLDQIELRREIYRLEPVDIQREMDLFGVIASSAVMSEPVEKVSMRMRRLQRARELSSELRDLLVDPMLRREARSELSSVSLTQMRSLRFDLAEFAAAIRDHARELETSSVQGHRSEQIVKCRLVRLAHSLCRYISPGFQAKRGSDAEGNEAGKLLMASNVLARHWFGAVPRLEYIVRGFIESESREIENAHFYDRFPGVYYYEHCPEEVRVNRRK